MKDLEWQEVLCVFIIKFSSLKNKQNKNELYKMRGGHEATYKNKCAPFGDDAD